MILRARPLLLLLLLLFPATARAQVPAARPTLRATPLTGEFHLDGRLDEAVWNAADSIAGFTETEPHEGGVPAARTVVKVLVSRDALIIGVRAEETDARGIVSYAIARDASLGNEDNLRLVLDPFGDGSGGYIFSVNPGGARFDALVANRGEGENSNWDAIWDAKTTRGDWGWSAEIRIPVRSLAFREGLDAWGFNIERRIQRVQETSRWASAQRDYKVGQTSRAGLLVGLPPFTLGHGLSVRPALTSGVDRPGPDADTEDSVDPSLDATQRIGGNLLASLTVNTDFAETDVDTRRTNLTRFPLFFPEKRTFFLEGADVFDFGLGTGTDVVPFFSRRIGLLSGRQVPILAGGKLNGRVGRTSIGALSVHTDEEEGLAPGTTFGVVRVRQDVLAESSIGMIATAGDPLGRADSWLAGGDVTYQTSRFRGNRNFLVGGWLLGVGREGLNGDRSAAGLMIDYPNDLWDISLNYKRIGESFEPSLGFVPRAGVHMAAFGADFKPRLTQLGLRQCFVENRFTWVAGLDRVWQSWRYFTAPINCRFETGDRVEVNWAPQGERLSEPFEIANGVVVAPGAYTFHRGRLEAGTAKKRHLYAQATWWFGEFYTGYLHQLTIDGAWNPSPLITVEFNAGRDIGRLPEGDFDIDVVGVRGRLNISPNLQLSSFAQYDSESRGFGSNTRLRWSFSPLGDLFVVYNHNLRDRLDRWSFESSQLLVKAQYTLRY